jgi:hypothetical protein
VLGAAQDPPNRKAQVEEVNRSFPKLIRTSSAFTDEACRYLAESDPRWGRKARRKGDASSRNGDALTYLWGTDVSKKAIVDIVKDSDSPRAAPGWIAYGGDNAGNGFWIPCPVGDVDTPDPPPPPPPVPPLPSEVIDVHARKELALAKDRVALLETALMNVRAELATFKTRSVSTNREAWHTHQVQCLVKEP